MNAFLHAHDEILRLLKAAKSAKEKCHAAVLYAAPTGAGVDAARPVPDAKAHNTERSCRNSLNHAEINVLNLAAETLWNNKHSESPTTDFFLFVNTRPCSKCTAAIADSQIFCVYFFSENEYRDRLATDLLGAETAELQAKAREKGLAIKEESFKFHFQPVPKRFLDDFQILDSR